MAYAVLSLSYTAMQPNFMFVNVYTMHAPLNNMGRTINICFAAMEFIIFENGNGNVSADLQPDNICSLGRDKNKRIVFARCTLHISAS